MPTTKTKLDDSVGKVSGVMTNKKNRGFFILVLSFIAILIINSLLPVIQGDAHYTVGEVSTTYGEFKTMSAEDPNYTLAWGSKKDITLYKTNYVISNGLNPEDKFFVEIPDDFEVSVNTKFFYEHPSWYTSTALSLASAVILFYSVFNYMLIVLKGDHVRYNELTKSVQKLCDESLDPVSFEPWMDHVFNHNRKVYQHKANIRFKIEALERKTNYEIKRKFKKYYAVQDETKAAIVLKALQPLKRKERKYVESKDRLLALLDDVYINNYAVNGHVKHFRYIHPLFVYNGTNDVGRTVDSYSTVRTDGERIKDDAFKKVLISLGISVVFAIVLTMTAVSSSSLPWYWVTINMVARISPLLIQIPLAIDYSNSFMDQQLVSNLVTRRAIGLRYLADMENGVSVRDPLDVELEEALENAETD